MFKDASLKKVEDEKELANPFPGLRPFNFAEKHLYFGREGQSEKILGLIEKNKFAAVLGPSGSGKSSLIQCGVIPQLYGGYLYEAGSFWKIIEMSPGYAPLKRFATALANTFAEKKKDKEAIGNDSNLNYALLTEKSQEFIDLIGKIANYNDENILIFIDQFEEIFRYKSEESDIDLGKEEVLRFINLFIEAIQQTVLPIYVVICMRSDFIGHCTDFQNLTEHINKSHFLVPQMIRDDFKSAILGPLAYTDVKINHDLLQEILNDLGNRPDMLPVLQHLMMRLFDHWMKRGNPADPISISEYKTVGKLQDGLSLHADEVYETLGDKGKIVCKGLFMCITESGADNRGIRRPKTVVEISQIIDEEIEVIINVAGLYRSQGISFITPTSEVSINGDSILDISHEAVMRNWSRLKGWIEEESDASKLYLRLVEASALYHSGRIGAWKPPELLLAMDWRDNFKPNPFWAKQYHPAFSRSLKFLEVSEAAYKAEIQIREREQKQKIRRTRWFAAILGVAALISVGLMINSVFLKRAADAARAEAEKQRNIAEVNAREAEKQKNIALQYADLLEEQNTIIEGKYVTAEDQREIAQRTASAALRQSSITEQNLEIVSKDKEIAEQTTIVAIEQKEQAEEERTAAYRTSMLLLAKTLSAQSLDVEDDEELKALLAYQAYKFNKENNGPENSIPIYLGLKTAIEKLEIPYYASLKGHRGSVRSIAYNQRTGMLYSGGSDGKLLKWNRISKNSTPEIIAQNNSMNRIVSVSENGRWLACGSEGIGIQLYDLSNNNNRTFVFKAHQNRVRNIVFYNNSPYILSSGIDNSIWKWDLTSGEQELFYETRSPSQAIAISKDDRYVAAGTKNGKLLLFSPGNTEPAVLYNEPGNQILSLTFRQKDRLLICGDQKGILRIWSVGMQEFVYTKQIHQARIVDICLDPSENFIATASTDGRALIINTELLNQPPLEVLVRNEFMFSVAFTNNGRTLFVANNNSKDPLAGYPFQLDDLAVFICPNINRNLSPSEWNYYIGSDISYEPSCNK